MSYESLAGIRATVPMMIDVGTGGIPSSEAFGTPTVYVTDGDDGRAIESGAVEPTAGEFFAEATWLMTAAGFGAVVGQVVAGTREGTAVGAILSMWWAARAWGRRHGR